MDDELEIKLRHGSKVPMEVEFTHEELQAMDEYLAKFASMAKERGNELYVHPKLRESVAVSGSMPICPRLAGQAGGARNLGERSHRYTGQGH